MTTDAPLNLILFDCDGTLVDSQDILVAAMSGAFRDHGIAPPSRSDILKLVGLSLPETFVVLSGGDRNFPVEALVEGYKTAFHRLRANQPTEPMYSGMRNVVADLRAHPETLLGIVTGKSQRGVRLMLEAHDMMGWFSTIQTADDAPSKPHPGMVHQAMTTLGAQPGGTVVIGDTTYDMEMAKAAGAWAIGVTWGYHPHTDLSRAGADIIVGAPEDLREVALDLLSRNAR